MLKAKLRRLAARWRSTLTLRQSNSTVRRPALIESLESRVQLSHGPTDLLPDLIPWASKEKGFVYGWRLDRTEQPGKILLRLSTSAANVGNGPLELRGGRGDKVNGQEVYQRIYDEQGGAYDRFAGRFTFHSDHDHTHFDNFAEYRLRNMTADGGAGKTIRTGHKVSFCLLDIEPYDPSLPGFEAGGSYDTCDTRRQGLSVGWADVYDYDLPDQWIDITNVEPGRYWLEVAIDPANNILETNESNNVTRIPINLKGKAIPVNDNFDRRFKLTGSNVSTHGSTARSSRENGEPQHADREGGSSVWYTWTAPFSGSVVMTTKKSRFDTLLAVYEGSSLSSLRRVAANDDIAPGKVASWVRFNVQQGKTYAIAVDGFRGASGTMWLTIRQGTK